VFEIRYVDTEVVDGVVEGTFVNKYSWCSVSKVFLVFHWGQSDIEWNKDGSEFSTGREGINTLDTVVEKESHAVALLDPEFSGEEMSELIPSVIEFCIGISAFSGGIEEGFMVRC
jgi:hypothetical protein